MNNSTFLYLNSRVVKNFPGSLSFIKTATAPVSIVSGGCSKIKTVERGKLF